MLSRVNPNFDKPSGHPFITEDTYRKLAAEYNIGEIQESWSGLKHPYYKGLAVAEEYFQSLCFYEGNIPHKLGELYAPFLKNYFKGSDAPSSNTNMATVGIAFIFRANHILQGPNFFDRLRTVPAQKMQSTINESMKGTRYITDRTTVIGRQNPEIRIPHSQAFLLMGLEGVASSATCGNCVIDGALSAYNTLEALWPELRHASGKPEDLSPAVDRLIM